MRAYSLRTYDFPLKIISFWKIRFYFCFIVLLDKINFKHTGTFIVDGLYHMKVKLSIWDRAQLLGHSDSFHG